MIDPYVVGRSSSASPTTETVALPIDRVVADVFRNAFVFGIIPDPTIPIIALPYGCAVWQQPIAVRHARYRGFVGRHNLSQRATRDARRFPRIP